MAQADKRSVTTDALQTLGTIIGDGEKRDAIHLAVEPATAAHSLRPGDHVGFVEGGVGLCDSAVGIVDPFLTTAIKAGEKFWLVVYPRQITSLRHVWTHPAFDDRAGPVTEQTPKEKAEAALRAFAATLPVHYSDLMEHAKYYADSVKDGGWGEYWTEGGRFEGVSVPDDFWDHYETLTGEKVADDNRGSFFSCAC